MEDFYVKITSPEQAERVLNIAVENGAGACEGVKGSPSEDKFFVTYMIGAFSYVGVLKNKTVVEVFRSCFSGAELLTLEELENRYMKKEFTKSDLVVGKHIIETASGERYLVLADGILLDLSNTNRWDELDRYNSNLQDSLAFTSSVAKVYVAKVYEVGVINQSFDLHDSKFWSLVWERPAVEEMTLEQVCEELGREVKIVK